MDKFIDIEDQDLPNKPRNLINIGHIVRIERLVPMDEGSPVKIHLIDGKVIDSKVSYAKFVNMLNVGGL